MTCNECNNKNKQEAEFWEAKFKALEKALQSHSCTRNECEQNPICALCVRGDGRCWSDCAEYDCFDFDHEHFLERYI